MSEVGSFISVYKKTLSNVADEAVSLHINAKNPFQQSIIERREELEMYMQNDMETLLTDLSECIPANVQQEMSEITDKKEKSRKLTHMLLMDESKAQVFHSVFIAMDKIVAAKILEEAAKAGGKSLCETNDDEKKDDKMCKF